MSEINMDNLREAVAAQLNQTPVAPEPLQPPVMQVSNPQVVAQPQPEAAPPVEAAPDIEVDDFVLDLDGQPTPEPAPVVEAPQSRSQWEQEFQLLKQNPRGQRIWENHSHMQKLAAPPEEGGIGFKPDVEEIKAWHEQSSTFKLMMDDVSSGDPEGKFSAFWFGQQGAAQIAANLPQVLSNVNPEAYAKIGQHYESKLLAEFQNLAGNPRYSEEDRARLADAAALIANVRQIPASPQTAQQPASGDSEIERLRREVHELRNGQTRQVAGSIKETVFNALDDAISRDADAALAPVRNSVKDPIMYDALKSKLVADMRQKAQANSGIRNQINGHLQEMYRFGNTAAMEKVVRLWRQGYADSLPAMRSQYLKAVGMSVVSKAASDKAVMQQAQDKTSPSIGSAPSNSVPVPGRQPGVSDRDHFRNLIGTAMSGGRP